MDRKLQHKLDTAKEFEAEGKSLHAIQIYNSLISEYPEHIEAYINLADLYQVKGQIKSAERILKQILTEQPENSEIKLYLAQFFMQNKEWVKALELLSDLSSKDPFVSYLNGYCYFKLSNYEMARLFFLNFIASDEEPELVYEAYYLLAKTEFELSQFENSLKYAKKAEVMYNNHWELYILFAKNYFCLGMFTHASDSILKGINLKPEEAVLYEWAGKINMKLDNFIKARMYFQKHIELKEKTTSGDYEYLAEACLKLGKLKEALNLYDTAIKMDPKNFSAMKGKEYTNQLLTNKLVSDA